MDHLLSEKYVTLEMPRATHLIHSQLLLGSAKGGFSIDGGDNVQRRNGGGGGKLVPFLGIKAEDKIQRGLPISRSGGVWVTQN